MLSVAAGNILPAKTISFFYEKIQPFLRKRIHSLRSTCHSTCPLSQRVLFSTRTSRFYESYTLKMTRRAGVSRRVIFRGHGEVSDKLKPSTNWSFAPFNLDLLEISSCEFSSGYGRSIVKYLRKVLPEGEVPQNLFEHFPNAAKVFMAARKIMIFIENLCFPLFL